jgi:hypothetical protein
MNIDVLLCFVIPMLLGLVYLMFRPLKTPEDE